MSDTEIHRMGGEVGGEWFVSFGSPNMVLGPDLQAPERPERNGMPHLHALRLSLEGLESTQEVVAVLLHEGFEMIS